MRWLFAGVLSIALAGTATAGSGTAGKITQRFANASSDACVANCASTNASCKRVCPTTFGTPCLASCDSQYQTCTQTCQNR